MDTLLHVAAPAVVLWFFLFVWHLWLAPAALAYEAIKAIPPPSPPEKPARAVPEKKDPPINWIVWKQMPSYTLKEFAAILAKDEPSSMKTPYEQAAFFKLIMSEAESGKLPYIREMLEGYGRPIERALDADSRIWREDAIKWADAHDGCDVSQIR